MDATELKKLSLESWHRRQQVRIQARLDALEQRLERIDTHYSREGTIGVGNSVDHAQIHENDMVVDNLDALSEASVPALRHALARIARGDYDTCETCGDPIGRPRLEVVPEANECVGCARVHETEPKA